MLTQINIGPTLAPSWRAVIERQLNFELAALHPQVRHLLILLEPANADNWRAKQETFCCRLEAELRTGETQVITALNRDPQICVADAAARLRRVVSRDKQLALMGRAS